MTDLSLLAAAIGLGATIVRGGFEDSVYSVPDGIARTNAELVQKIADMIRCMGCDVATPQEAREILQTHTEKHP